MFPFTNPNAFSLLGTRVRINPSPVRRCCANHFSFVYPETLERYSTGPLHLYIVAGRSFGSRCVTQLFDMNDTKNAKIHKKGNKYNNSPPGEQCMVWLADFMNGLKTNGSGGGDIEYMITMFASGTSFGHSLINHLESRHLYARLSK